jgi:hypothetical protein
MTDKSDMLGKGGFEWRVFFPTPKQSHEELNFISSVAKSKEKIGENRSDVYILVKDDTLGLKFRNTDTKSPSLELKTRSYRGEGSLNQY